MEKLQSPPPHYLRDIRLWELCKELGSYPDRLLSTEKINTISIKDDVPNKASYRSVKHGQKYFIYKRKD